MRVYNKKLTNNFLSQRERIEVRVWQDKEQTGTSPEFLDSLTFMKKFYPLLQVEGAYHSFSRRESEFSVGLQPIRWRSDVTPPTPRIIQDKVGMRVLQDKELLTPHLTSPKERKQQLPLQGGWCLKGRRGFNKTSIEPPPAFVGLTMFVNNNSLLLKEGLLREQERRLYA